MSVLGREAARWMGAAVVVLAACRRAPPPERSLPARGPTAVAAAKAAAPHVADACDLLSERDVGAILGVSLDPPRRSAGICQYRRAGDAGNALATETVGIRVYRSLSRASFDTEAASMASLLRATPRPLAGVGEAAWEVGDALLFAFAEGRAVGVMRGEAGVGEEEERALARLALARAVEAR